MRAQGGGNADKSPRAPAADRYPRPVARHEADILALQRTVGNQAVNRMLQGEDGPARVIARMATSKRTAPDGGKDEHKPVKRQKSTPDYGDLRKDETGTWMRTGLVHDHLGSGSPPSVKPSWWPALDTDIGKWFYKFMVQGHLLNQNLGGPGNEKKNLTPLARTTNTKHEKSSETHVKNAVIKKGFDAQ
jgi:hypothetical protein